jgi:hypothetical protein
MDAIPSTEKISQRLAWAKHHRDQLGGIAVDLARLLDVDVASEDGRDLRRVVMGEIDFDQAMRQIVNRRLDEFATIEVDGAAK